MGAQSINRSGSAYTVYDGVFQTPLGPTAKPNWLLDKLGEMYPTPSLLAPTPPQVLETRYRARIMGARVCDIYRRIQYGNIRNIRGMDLQHKKNEGSFHFKKYLPNSKVCTGDRWYLSWDSRRNGPKSLPGKRGGLTCWQDGLSTDNPFGQGDWSTNDIWILRLDCGSFGLVRTRLLCSILYFGRSVSSCLVFTDTTKIYGGLLSSRCTRQVKDPVAVAKTSDSW